jgi:CheY-like chemotaxis protein
MTATPAATHLVVCVDDEPPILSAVRRVLRHEPYELVTTTSAQEALDLLDRREVSVVIADQRMPDMTGVRLLEAVRKKSPRTACVILTGYAEAGDITAAMNAGTVQRLVKKPWEDAALRRVVSELLREREMGTPAAPGAEPPRPARTVVRLECGGRRPDDVLAEAARLLEAAPGRSARLTLVLDNLKDLCGSLTGFLTELARRLVASGLRAALVDGSGYAGSFLEIVGGMLPLVVYSSESELAEPRRVLVVEDQEESMNYLLALIEAAGHSCSVAGSVADAIRKLDSEPFDLVLLDLVLPDADGIDVARHVLERHLRIPVIAVSGYLDRWADASYARAGIRRHLSKPVRVKDILDAIRNS